ncbi:hypothetical protein CK623_08335 [Vandammella animalimorsus]|uniref:DUF3352 domain-containing protein n=1 Tax=Vandammella animalimorsus TaxID=2029117 RepID=A0A2A2APT1_9BURK|nr:hypothetical protein [Vandammella animalimorsus]PAT39846.1 hypothetical protein CK623_08335 [Vandammella animalimorsus]
MKKTTLAIALAVALSACSKNEDSPEVGKQQAQPAAPAKADIPLAFAPSATAFVAGAMEPAPQAYIDTINGMAQQFKVGMLQSLERARQALAQEEQNEQTARANAVMDLLKERLQQPDTLASLGMSLKSLGAVYEIGGAPVLRMELQDADKFRAFIAEVETRAGQKLETGELNGQAYWFMPLGEQAAQPAQAAGADAASAQPLERARLVTAIVGQHLVLALDPQHSAAPLAQLLGLERPAQSILQAGTLTELQKAYGYKPYGGNMLVDTRRVLALFTEGQSIYPPPANWSEACRSEFAALAAKAPRLVVGATEVDGKKVGVAGTLELDKPLAGELQKLSAPVPGLGSAKKGLEFGFGLKIDQLAGFLQAQANAVQTAPYQCEHLQPLNEGMASLNQSLAGLYAASGWLTGARLVLNDINIEQQLVRGMLVVASPNPMSLLGMAQGMMPELAQLGLEPNGAAKQLQSPMTAMVNGGQDPIWVAMTDKSLGLGIGADAKGDLEGALKASALSPEPLLYYRVDGETYAKSVGKFNEQMLNSLEANSAGAQQANDIMVPLMQSVAQIYQAIDYASVRYHFSERGLELDQIITFK